MKEFKPTRLYIKELAGVKYFGKSIIQNIEKYAGSGVVWKDRIKKYGRRNIKTLWVSDWYYDPEEIKKIALHFSEENQIVESREWANVKPEDGLDGGLTSVTPETIEKGKQTVKNKTDKEKQIVSQNLSKSLKGMPKPPDFGDKIRKYRIGKKSDESSKQAMRDKWTDKRRKEQAERTRLSNENRPILTCPHCGFSSKGNMKRYHFDNCKSRKY